MGEYSCTVARCPESLGGSGSLLLLLLLPAPSLKKFPRTRRVWRRRGSCGPARGPVMPKGMNKAFSQKSYNPNGNPDDIKDPALQFDPFAAAALLPLSERMKMKEMAEKKKSETWDQVWERKKKNMEQDPDSVESMAKYRSELDNARTQRLAA